MLDRGRLKVAVLVKRFVPTGGAERYALEVTRRVALRHDVHVFAREWSFQGQENIAFHKIPKFINKPNWLNQLLFSRDSRRGVGNGFDIVHSHEKVTHFDLMTIHSPCFRSFITREKSPLRRGLLWFSAALSPRKLAWLWLEAKQFAYHHERLFIAVSENVKRDVQSNYPLPDTSFRIAYPGVDAAMRRHAVDGSSRNRFRSKFGLPKEDLVLLFVGTEFRRKGLDALLQALSLISPSRFRLVVAGGGGGKMERYVGLVKKLGLEDRVSFLGLVENVEELYPVADALILPTLSDPAPMVPIEAMFCGVPTAMSSMLFCGAAEHIRSGEALIINDPRNPIDIAEILRRLMDVGLRSELGRKGQALASQLTWEKSAETTLMAYDEVLRRKQRG
jgi:glycosyltransferase involved in cell wall biosynthesis